jgi:AraC-like DNA-binding protein
MTSIREALSDNGGPHMDRVRISTDHLPERDQFSFWREELLEGRVGTTAERSDRGSFAGEVNFLISPSVVRMRMQAEGFTAPRRSTEIARVGWQDSICLFHHVGDGIRFDRRGRERLRLGNGHGQILVLDPSLPVDVETSAGLNDMWLLPRALIEPHLPAGAAPIWLSLPAGGNRVSGLILTYLAALSAQMESLTEAELGAVVDNFCRLIAIGCGSAIGEQRKAIHAARVEQIKRYVNLHLAQPNLSPASVAAAHKISVRELHRLFEPTGLSFMQFVTSRRLEECRASFLNPANTGRAVADIALGWGFNSLPAFYRSFSSGYGLSPRDLRASGRRQPAGQD